MGRCCWQWYFLPSYECPSRHELIALIGLLHHVLSLHDRWHVVWHWAEIRAPHSTSTGDGDEGNAFRLPEPDQHLTNTSRKYWWLCEIAYCFSSIFCKVSICIFLMRITVKRQHIWALYTVMALTVLAGLIFMFLLLLQCKPLSYFWMRTALDPSIEGYCISINIIIVMSYIYSAFAALCDFTVGILPIFIVRKLHMKREAKLAVVGILSMACMYVISTETFWRLWLTRSSASSAVIIRFPFVKTFANKDFLCTLHGL